MEQDFILQIIDTRARLQNHSVAKRILHLMTELRSEADEATERRWIWELLQNAKDVCLNDSIEIKISLNEADNRLQFSHTGSPFSIENIVGLIEQIGTKERDLAIGEKRSTIGKFGTGFITTHLLSEKINLSSYLSDSHGRFVKFDLLLDRSGRTLEEISNSVNRSIELLLEICANPSDGSFVAGNYNTCFEYELTDSNYGIATAGLNDLKNTLPYTLVFANQIKKLSLVNEGLVFQTTDNKRLTEKISTHTIIISNTNNEEPKHVEIITVDGDDVQIAFEYQELDGVNYILPFNASLPRIFCEFPLIGTENVGIPFVVNSSVFNPNKDRTGIALTDKPEEIVLENKKLLKNAVALYRDFLKYIETAGTWKNTYNLANIVEVEENNLISRAWFKDEIVDSLRSSFIRARMAELNDGSVSPIVMQDNSHIDFPSYSKEELFDEFWKICSFSDKFILPKKEDVKFWNKVRWLKQYSLSIDTIVKWIVNQNDLKTIVNELQQNEEDVIAWLNVVIQFIEKNNDELMSLSLFLNQDGYFKQKDVLFFDVEPIPEQLKEILQDFGINIRNELLDFRVAINIPENRAKTTQQIAGEIERLLKPLIAEVPRQVKTKSITRKLLQWFNSNKEIAEKSFLSLYPNRHLLRDEEELIEDMQKAETFDKLLGKLNLDFTQINDFIKNENGLILKVNENLYNVGEEDIEQSVVLSDNSDEKARISISYEAKEIIIEKLKSKGFTVPSNIEIKYTVISGIVNPDGTSVKIVVKSGKGGKLYFNPNEWLTLSEPDAQLFVVTRGNIVRNVTINDLTAINDTFHMRFNTNAFAINTNLKVFANFFRYLPYTHFIFETPESTSDYLMQFGLSERNPSSKELTADDKNLLH